jgi:hypothetical protein
MISIFVRDLVKKLRRKKVTAKNTYQQRNRYIRKLHLKKEQYEEVENPALNKETPVDEPAKDETPAEVPAEETETAETPAEESAETETPVEESESVETTETPSDTENKDE